ncbi:hypothetical protein ACFQEX_25355 [Roseibium salinum]|uniref:hypothetical protein n=1 Tax=Roseibium salinum TaxID=1604349 RepID=UPI003623852D
MKHRARIEADILDEPDRAKFLADQSPWNLVCKERIHQEHRDDRKEHPACPAPDAFHHRDRHNCSDHRDLPRPVRLLLQKPAEVERGIHQDKKRRDRNGHIGPADLRRFLALSVEAQIGDGQGQSELKGHILLRQDRNAQAGGRLYVPQDAGNAHRRREDGNDPVDRTCASRSVAVHDRPPISSGQ